MPTLAHCSPFARPYVPIVASAIPSSSPIRRWGCDTRIVSFGAWAEAARRDLLDATEAVVSVVVGEGDDLTALRQHAGQVRDCHDESSIVEVIEIDGCVRGLHDQATTVFCRTAIPSPVHHFTSLHRTRAARSSAVREAAAGPLTGMGRPTIDLAKELRRRQYRGPAVAQGEERCVSSHEDGLGGSGQGNEVAVVWV